MIPVNVRTAKIARVRVMGLSSYYCTLCGSKQVFCVASMRFAYCCARLLGTREGSTERHRRMGSVKHDRRHRERTAASHRLTTERATGGRGICEGHPEMPSVSEVLDSTVPRDASARKIPNFDDERTETTCEGSSSDRTSPRRRRADDGIRRAEWWTAHPHGVRERSHSEHKHENDYSRRLVAGSSLHSTRSTAD